MRFCAVDLEMVTNGGLTVDEHALASAGELTGEIARRRPIIQYGDRREDVSIRLYPADVVAVPDLGHHDVADDRLP